MMKVDLKALRILALVGVAPTLFFNFGQLLIGEFQFSLETLIGVLISALYSSFYTVCIGAAVSATWNKIHLLLPYEKGLFKRYSIQLALTNIVGIVIMVILTWLTIWTYKDKTVDPVKIIYRDNILITIVMTTMLVTISELIFYFKQWKDSLVEKERLEKENIQSQFQSLKNQVNPHFLFNSLNTLSALIHKDADQADDFIDELAKVYRYILDFDDKHLVTIEEELEFVRSYTFLQKIRFGDNLKVKIEVEEEYLEDYIPPLSMQILVENAIKHNTISKDNPLFVCVQVEKGSLIVKNNLQLRMEKHESTGIGLENIRRRYELFAGKTPQFNQTDKAFLAEIPILKNEIS